MSSRAWITLATNDSYGLGALVLASSLRRAGSAYPAVVLITPSVTDAMRDRLSAVFAEVVTVNVLDSHDAAHLALLQRPELGITFTKIHCWSLVQYEKCVFLDADTLIVQNCDELFEREELSAAPDVGWPDCFNSGVFVFKPSQETFEKLIQFAQERGSFDGGDQGLLNSFFSDWARGDINKHLPFLYNVTSAAFYSYLPALKHYGQNLKIIHFIGATKPWLQRYNWESSSVDAPDHLKEFLQLWWDLFISQVHSQLDTAMVDPEEASTSLPPQDVFKYYSPTVDPNSEFPWHQAENQNDDDETEFQKIDLSEFFDPWLNFRGNLSPCRDDIASCSESKTHDQIQQNVWEYCSNPNQNHNQSCHQSNQYWFESQQSHHNEQQWCPGGQAKWQHNEPTESQNRPWHTEHSNQHNNHNYKPQTDHYVYHCTEKEIRGEDNQRQPYYSDENHYHQNNLTDNHQNHTHQDNHQNHTYQDNQNRFSQDRTSHHHIDELQKHSCSNWNHSNQESHSVIEHRNHSHQPSYSDDSQNHHRTFHNILEVCNHSIDQHVNIIKTNNSNIHSEAQLQRTAYNDDKESIECEQSKTNGCIEDEEDEYIEVIKPRHPYDDFYLRHKPTIDSRGRKICIHELPPTPSPSPPPESPPLVEATNVNDIDDQSGVAGNFARVVPGSPGFQYEAVDELTRRQGWEAGNIDYMGADSFDNIWAKISQTLSKPQTSSPRQSPPKEPSPPKQSSPLKEPSPPKQSSPPKGQSPTEESKEETPASVILESLTAVAESVARVDTAIPANVESAPTLLSDPADDAVEKDKGKISAPETSSEPVDIVKATIITDVPTTSEDVTVDDSPKLVDAPKPTEVVALVDAPISVESPSSADVISTGKAPVLEESIPVTETVDVIKAPALSESVPITQDVSAGAAPASVKSPSEAINLSKSTESAAVTSDAKVSATIEAPLAAEAPAAIVTSTTLEAIPLVEPKTTVESTTAKTALSAPTASEPASGLESQPEPTLKKETKEKTEIKSVVEPTKEAVAVTPEKKVESTATDSPPLAHTPSKEEPSAVQAAKSDERRKPLGKLLLSAPTAADPLPTPDSELEDAASLAQSIIASELRTPTVSSPSPSAAPTSPPHPKQEKRLSVEEPEVPTPPVTTPVSLAQIGVKSKGKSSIASQIESSITEPDEQATVPASSKTASTPSTPSDSKKSSPKSPEPAVPASSKPATKTTSVTSVPAEGVKKKLDKKGSKESATAGEAPVPVPPPRKKEKKPKEK